MSVQFYWLRLFLIIPHLHLVSELWNLSTKKASWKGHTFNYCDSRLYKRGSIVGSALSIF